MIDILTKLKTPDKINLSVIKWYWDNTPSVTWLLSLIDSYEPNSEDIQEALDKWTAFHSDMETILTWKEIYLKSNSSWSIYTAIPYAWLLLPQSENEILKLEHQIVIPWVFWWTIDYDKEKSIDWNFAYSLLDYKTAKVFPSINSVLFQKYSYQLNWYELLKSTLVDAIFIKKSLMFVNENVLQFVSLEDSNDDKISFMILICYYHYLNWTLNTDNQNLISFLNHNQYRYSFMMSELTQFIESDNRINTYDDFIKILYSIETLLKSNKDNKPVEVISKPKHTVLFKK